VSKEEEEGGKEWKGKYFYHSSCIVEGIKARRRAGRSIGRACHEHAPNRRVLHRRTSRGHASHRRESH
jgi:hypothetical protein